MFNYMESQESGGSAPWYDISCLTVLLHACQIWADMTVVVSYINSVGSMFS